MSELADLSLRHRTERRAFECRDGGLDLKMIEHHGSHIAAASNLVKQWSLRRERDYSPSCRSPRIQSAARWAWPAAETTNFLSDFSCLSHPDRYAA